jgi:alpha-glucosidase
MKILPWSVLILVLTVCGQAIAADEPKITAINPPELDFFSKQVVCEGIPIKAHKDVADKALLEAHRRLSRMLANLPVVRQNLVDVGAELQIIGKDQQTSDLPSERHWKGKPYETRGDKSLTIDQRTRGVGGLPASCGEENLLKLPVDRYRDHRDICTHEFAHTVLEYGLSPDVRDMLRAQYRKSLDKGLWKTAYRIVQRAARRNQEFPDSHHRIRMVWHDRM